MVIACCLFLEQYEVRGAECRGYGRQGIRGRSSSLCGCLGREEVEISPIHRQPADVVEWGMGLEQVTGNSDRRT